MANITIDYTNDAFWQQIEKDFYENATKSVQVLVDEGRKETVLKFWVDLQYDPGFIYTDTEEEGDGIGDFDIPVLWEAYEHYEEEGGMPIEYSDLEKKLFKHCGNALNKMAQDNCFEGIYEDNLSVFFGTVDTDYELICKIKK